MISHKEAVKALLATYREKADEKSLGSEDYFWGSYDRWALAISELSRVSAKGRILDIGAWDGLFCTACKKVGFSTAAVDWGQPMTDSFWREKGIEWHNVHIEADALPFPDNEFMGVYMGQVLEHFTYSPRKPFGEIRRVLKPGGVVVVDVPNVGEWHNFYRLIRGKNILYDYKKHYIDEDPIVYKGMSYFCRHNHEFTWDDLRALAESCGFQVIKVAFIRSRRHGEKGFRRIEVPFSALRDVIPLFRKSLMLTAKKP